MFGAATIRLGLSIAILLAMAGLEIAFPRRPLTEPKGRRWLQNLGLNIAGTLAVRLVVPVSVVYVATVAADRGWGLFNVLSWPAGVEAAIAFVLLDLTGFLQHAMFHAVPLMWRLHMVHHTDLDLDASSGLRFHPLEIAVSLGIKLLAVMLLGPAPWIATVFEVVLNGTSVFNHSNLRLAPWLDRALRWLVVTPDMHRIHHSIRPFETNSNFGFNFTFWDRLFGTYCDEPTAGHLGMTVGLAQYRSFGELTLPRLLLLPFTGQPGEYPINRREDRRLFRRVSWVGRLRVRSGAGEVGEGSGDVSVGGCLVLTETAFHVGEKVSVELPAGTSRALAVEGIVIRTQRTPLPVVPPMLAIAIEFNALRPVEERELSTLLDRRATEARAVHGA